MDLLDEIDVIPDEKKPIYIDEEEIEEEEEYDE